jgi:predicted thioesterase
MQFDNINPGIGAEKTVTVDNENTAESWGSGGLPVFATPSMIALMEFTALSVVEPFLPEGCSTVGTEINVRHLAASPVGMKITCKAELVEADRRRLVFRVEAFDEAGKIGEGTHGRFIIENERFMKKIQEKAQKY